VSLPDPLIRTQADRAVSQIIRAQLAAGSPLAVSKCGFSEQAMLVLPPQLHQADAAQLRALRQTLMTHACLQLGVFPASHDHVLTMCTRLADSYSGHDAVAFSRGSWVTSARDRLPSMVHAPTYDALDVRFTNADHAFQAMLDSLAGKRVLIITTPAEFLAARANRTIFERVWQRTGRRWFSPHSVSAMSFPFAYDPSTHRRYRNTLSLLDDIVERMSRQSFDVALIGAAILGPVLAEEIRRQGRAAFSLGSQLQLLFGVTGRRWDSWSTDPDSMVTDAWTSLPSEFDLPAGTPAPDGGAYWASSTPSGSRTAR
jgi:hypothetical protein